MWLIAAATLAAAAAAAQTSDTSADRISLAALLEEALQQNPEVQSAERRHEAARAVVPQQQALPDPMFGVEYRDVESRETMYGVTQEVPFPGKLRLRGEIANREAERAGEEYLATRLRVAAALKEAFYDLNLAHRAIEIVTRNRTLLEQFEEAARARYTVGQGAQQDVFRAQAEVSRVRARMAAFVQQRESFAAQVNRLRNRPPAEPLGRPEDVSLTPVLGSVDEISARVDAGVPLLRVQTKDVERGYSAVALARREYYPDFEFGVGGVREEPMGTDGYRVMLNVRVPLYFQNKQQRGVEEAIARREASVADLHAVRQELLFHVKDEMATVARAEEQVRVIEDAIIPQAQLALGAAQAGYAVGMVDFLTLLNALLTLQENQLERYGEIAEHEKARARLEEILGEAP